MAALTDGLSSHIPFRDSKLTRLLSRSLGSGATPCGNAKLVGVTVAGGGARRVLGRW